eukprot:TRINITY_DN15421_c0_g1_i1.p1 TRINITY_DN15421_c0_g1~~TRINITY_DN15421_c0_g1_i1.p1  ORF type:complete len:325 (-),score=52.19 TRINITY_DN15421_c0_g1_i1:221-1195(-)
MRIEGQLPEDAQASSPFREDDDCDLFSKYEKLDHIGEGTYGYVYRALCLRTRRKVAIKETKILDELKDQGIPGTALREIALLKECEHANVIKLYDLHSSLSCLSLVFECLDMDLRAYLKGRGPLRDAKLRSANYQCFAGIEYCHNHRILHRDLKPQNVLVELRTMRMVLADFGLARTFSLPLKVYSHDVVTLWYRAPEVLLGQFRYGPPIDIWSQGCILAEMATSKPLFPGDSEISTIFKIFRNLGTPTEREWPGITSLQDYKASFPKWNGSQLGLLASCLGEEGMDLLGECLRYNCTERPSARAAVRHEFHHGAMERSRNAYL